MSTDFEQLKKNISPNQQIQSNQNSLKNSQSINNGEVRTMLVETKVQRTAQKWKNQNKKKTKIVLNHERTMSQDTHQQLKANKKLSLEDQMGVEKNQLKNQSQLRSSKQISKSPSLRKIKKAESCNEQIGHENSQQTNQNFKKVKFEQIIDEQEIQQQKNKTKKAKKSNQSDVDKFYQNFKFQNIHCQQEKNEEPTQNFMQFLCGLLKLKPKFIQRSKDRIEKRLLKLNKLKIKGEKQEIKMLEQINKKLTYEQFSEQGSYWNKLGFTTNNPIKELQNKSVLMLLQWRNFVIGHEQQAIKLCNFLIEMSLSLLQFHKQATQFYCSQLSDCNLQAKNWNEYQQLYNTLTLMASQDLQSKSKQISIESLKQEIPKIFKKRSKNLQKERNKLLKKGKQSSEKP